MDSPEVPPPDPKDQQQHVAIPPKPSEEWEGRQVEILKHPIQFALQKIAQFSAFQAVGRALKAVHRQAGQESRELFFDLFIARGLFSGFGKAKASMEAAAFLRGHLTMAEDTRAQLTSLLRYHFARGGLKEFQSANFPLFAENFQRLSLEDRNLMVYYVCCFPDQLEKPIHQEFFGNQYQGTPSEIVSLRSSVLGERRGVQVRYQDDRQEAQQAWKDQGVVHPEIQKLASQQRGSEQIAANAVNTRHVIDGQNRIVHFVPADRKIFCDTILVEEFEHFQFFYCADGNGTGDAPRNASQSALLGAMGFFEQAFKMDPPKTNEDVQRLVHLANYHAHRTIWENRERKTFPQHTTTLSLGVLCEDVQGKRHFICSAIGDSQGMLLTPQQLDVMQPNAEAYHRQDCGGAVGPRTGHGNEAAADLRNYQIRELIIDSGDPFLLIVGSDGVWDCLNLRLYRTPPKEFGFKTIQSWKELQDKDYYRPVNEFYCQRKIVEFLMELMQTRGTITASMLNQRLMEHVLSLNSTIYLNHRRPGTKGKPDDTALMVFTSKNLFEKKELSALIAKVNERGKGLEKVLREKGIDPEFVYLPLEEVVGE